MRQEEIIALLPRTTRALVELIGFDETCSLLEKFGGTKRYIPKNPAAESALRHELSEPAFRKLCATYSGETIELPKPDSLRRAQRDYQIALLTEEGASRTQLVAQYGLSQRQIGNIRKRYRETGTTPVRVPA